MISDSGLFFGGGGGGPELGVSFFHVPKVSEYELI